MEDIISKLAEIEAAASHIMEDVSEQKSSLHRNMRQQSGSLTKPWTKKCRKKPGRLGTSWRLT